MSKIEYNSNTGSTLSMYRQILQEKISSVCSKTGFDDSEITWIIFEHDATPTNTILDSFFIGMHGKDYCYCDSVQKKIWISTLALQRSGNPIMSNAADISGRKSAGDDFLADVLIGGITRIQTGESHGDSSYDEKFRENKEKYYSSSFGEASIRD